MNIIQGMRLSRMRIVLITLVLAIAGLLVSVSQLALAGSATAHAAGGSGPKPVPVLEQAASSDGSSWNAVITPLQGNGSAVALPNTLRGLASDSATLGDLLSTTSGTSGTVVTNAFTYEVIHLLKEILSRISTLSPCTSNCNTNTGQTTP